MYAPPPEKPFPPADPFLITRGISPKFALFTPDDFTTEPPPPRTPLEPPPTLFFSPPLSRYTARIIPLEACVRPYRLDLNDGVWHNELKRYIHKPCRRLDCPRHWLRYALERYRDLARTLPNRANWYHVRLTLPERLSPAGRPTAIRTWMTRMQAALPDVSLTAVAHRGRLTDHYHVLTGSGEKVPPALPGSIWEAARPFKRAVPWSEGMAFCEPRPNPKRVLYYMLTRDTVLEGQPTVCPWKGIGGHPVRTL